MENKKSTFIDKIWDFLASVRLAIVIFALISLTSIIGTVLDQRAEDAKNIQILSKLFGDDLGPRLFNLFNSLGFMDMYHSWWFMGLLILFSVNLIICSLERLPRTWRMIRSPMKTLAEENLSRLPIKRDLSMKKSGDEAKSAVIEALKSSGFHAHELKDDNGLQILAQKGNFSRLAVYATHFSILVILIGAVIGLRFGFKGYLNLPEGEIYNTVAVGTHDEIALPFDIRCDTFEVDFYENSDMPKEYRSWLTILENGREVLRKSIIVNDPLKYKGITIYQSSYGMIPNSLSRGLFVFKLISNNGKSADLNLRFGDTFQIPGTTIEGKIIDFSPALKIDEHGHVFTYSSQMNNPAVYISFTDSGKPMLSGWILKRYPETWQLPGGHRAEFLDFWGVQFTGLQIRKDPGVWVVYLGCITMSISLFIAFFISHRKIWVKIIPEKNNTKLIIGATANKSRLAFERKIDKIVAGLTHQKGGS